MSDSDSEGSSEGSFVEDSIHHAASKDAIERLLAEHLNPEKHGGQRPPLEQHEFSVCFVGRSGVGKTSLISRLLQPQISPPPPPPPTQYGGFVGDCYFLMQEEEHHMDGTVTSSYTLVTLKLMDISGQESAFQVNKLWITKAQACVAVAAVDNPDSYMSLDALVERAQNLSVERNGYELLVYRFMNKNDLPEAKWSPSKDVVNKFATQHNMFELSHKASIMDVLSVFDELVRSLLELKSQGKFRVEKVGTVPVGPRAIDQDPSLEVGPDGRLQASTLPMPTEQSCADLSTAMDVNLGFGPEFNAGEGPSARPPATATSSCKC